MSSTSNRRRTTFLCENKIQSLLEDDEWTISDSKMEYSQSDPDDDNKAMLLLLLITQTPPRDEGMAQDHGAPESGQLPRAWILGRRGTESRQRVSGAKSP